MDRWKAEMGRVREKRRVEERRAEEQKREDQRRERVRRKKMQVREKVGKSRNTVFFRWLVAPEGRKVGSLKRRVRSHLARWEMKNCTPLWHEAHFQVKMYKAPHARTTFGSCDVQKVHAVVAQIEMYKTHQVWTTFGSWDVEKVHAVVARSTFRSQNAQNTPGSDHFWKLRCLKSARRCGAKHISKSKCTKHTRVGPLLEVAMSKKCMPLWREAHFEVKMLKAQHVRTTFGRSGVVSRGRRKGLCTLSKVSKTWSFVAFSTTTTTNYITLHSNTLHYNYNYTFTAFHYTTGRYTTLHYTHHTTLNCTTPHSTTLHYITLHYIPLHYTTLH